MSALYSFLMMSDPVSIQDSAQIVNTGLKLDTLRVYGSSAAILQ